MRNLLLAVVVASAQRQRLRTRESRGRDIACLSKAYNDRIGQF